MTILKQEDSATIGGRIMAEGWKCDKCGDFTGGTYMIPNARVAWKRPISGTWEQHKYQFCRGCAKDLKKWVTKDQV